MLVLDIKIDDDDYIKNILSKISFLKYRLYIVELLIVVDIYIEYGLCNLLFGVFCLSEEEVWTCG